MTLPYCVGRTDDRKLVTGKKRRRFRTYAAATEFVATLPVGIRYYIETPDGTATAYKNLPKKITEDGIYLDVPSNTRSDKTHHVYTGDTINSPACTCEAYLHGTREVEVLYTCTHIRKNVYGKEK